MMLLDYFGGFLLDFWKKGQNQQIWANFEVLRSGVGIPCSSVAEKKVWTALGTPRHSKAMPWRSTIHNMEIFVFYFVLLFHYYEDLSIRLIRTL